MPQPEEDKRCDRFSYQVLGGSSWSQLIWPTYLPAQIWGAEWAQVDSWIRLWMHLQLHRHYNCLRPQTSCGKVHVISTAHQQPPLAQFNSQTEEIRANCNYLTTLEAISSKWKEHKRFLYLTLISRWRSHSVFTWEKKHRNICFWNDTEGEHVQGISRRRNFHGVRQQHRDHSRL